MLNINDSNKYQAIQKGDKQKLITFKKHITKKSNEIILSTKISITNTFSLFLSENGAFISKNLYLFLFFLIKLHTFEPTI
jgi:hypothetical protein